MCSKQGVIKKTSLEAYSRPRSNGINAITIRDNDELLEAKLTNGTNEIVLATSSGRAIRFNESTVRPMGRNASGVRAVTLQSESDEVVGMICVKENAETIMVVSEKGYGKRSYLSSIKQTITEETLASEALSVDQVIDEEFLNSGIENISNESVNTGSTFIIITNMTCDQSGIVKNDSEWLLPIKLTYLPALEGGATEAVEKLESGYGNYKIRVKDVNSNETYENFMTKDKFIKFFTLNDFSDEAKFVVPKKGGGISDAEPGIKDNLFKENFYVSLIKDGNELYKVNIKL
jgi:hypothetical protein